ncbi:MAG: ATP-grasp domain-containing protein, partial [Erysipelotrichaceae bacterium]|nr:ATP-grasp domain-containing protein [Erysipelotrichaceae bacterium]
MKKALVLAGGIAQVALIDELKNRGYRTLLADMNPHCVAAPYADEFFKVSAMDTDALAELAVKENVNLVLTACADQILVAEVKVCEKLGLPTYLDLKTTELVSDKSYMKDVFTRHSIPTSLYTTVTGYDEKKFEGLSFPLVVKPVDAYSARGVRRCNDKTELQEYLSKAIEISRSKKAIVEEFVEGDELTVEAFVIDGKATVLCIGAKNKLKDGKFVGCGSLY